MELPNPANTSDQHARVRGAHAADYAALDKECEALTEDEVYLGTFEVVEARSGT